MNFEIVRKINKVQGTGLSLRSFQASPAGASMLLLSSGYSQLKTQLAAFCMQNSYVIETHVRGKSLELCCDGEDAVKGLALFAETQSFLGEDAPVCIHFLADFFPLRGAELISLNMDLNQFSLCLNVEEGDKFKTYIMPILDQHDMGIAIR